jgi:molybdenum cofactor biosynthesis protein B
MKVHEEHKSKGKKHLNIALVVISTSRFDEMKKGMPTTDKTIPLVKDLLKSNDSISLIHIEVIPDQKSYIKYTLNKLIENSELDAIIFSGGTGITKKDITYEIIEPLLEKRITGFGELFRYLSYKEIGSSAMLSRALAGILKTKAIFLLPGSPNAVKLAFDQLIIPELKHISYLINKEE